MATAIRARAALSEIDEEWLAAILVEYRELLK